MMKLAGCVAQHAGRGVCREPRGRAKVNTVCAFACGSRLTQNSLRQVPMLALQNEEQVLPLRVGGHLFAPLLLPS